MELSPAVIAGIVLLVAVARFVLPRVKGTASYVLGMVLSALTLLAPVLGIDVDIGLEDALANFLAAIGVAEGIKRSDIGRKLNSNRPRVIPQPGRRS